MVKVEIIIPEANIFHLCIFETQLFFLHQVFLNSKFDKFILFPKL